MTPQQKQWFEALVKDREGSADTLEKPSMRGVQRSVVDKYSDQAHFIYELLQNADDVEATSARFELRSEGLLFAHNGKKRFTISNPDTEDADSANETLGHVNSITSIANSSKTKSSIGKFGVGFKAVFQYTKTPHIYDPDFRFRIERFIVPCGLDTDFNGRQADETVFWFPFDHDRKRPDECWDDIIQKLKVLVFPTLFLSSLESVSYATEGQTGQYSKKVTKQIAREDLTANLISLVSEIDGKKEKQRLWLFSPRKGENGHPYCVGYAVEKNKLKPIVHPAFCFFPTKQTTNLNFIIHAPFLLTDNREGIMAGDEHNRIMVQRLADLAADSLVILRDENLIDDGIIDIIPHDETVFSELSDRNRISFKPFFTAAKAKLQSEKMLPSSNGQSVFSKDAFWFQDQPIVSLFSDKQLAQLTGNKDAQWVFTGTARNKTEGERKAINGCRTVYPKRDYIDNLIAEWFEMEELLAKIGAPFIQAQSQKWLHQFYEYLHNNPSRAKVVKKLPIFLDQRGTAVPAFDEKDQLVLFLSDDNISGYVTVKKELLSNKTTREFIEKFGIKKPSLRDEIYNKILPAYNTNEEIDTSPHFMMFFRYFKECRNEEVSSFINLIRDKAFLLYATANNRNRFRGKAEEIYLPTDDLKAWFETKTDAKFLVLDTYREMVGEKDYEQMDAFLRQLGVLSAPSICTRAITYNEAISISAPHGKGRWYGSEDEWEDRYIDGCKECIEHVTHDKSILIWRILAKKRITNELLNGKYIYNNRGRWQLPFPSTEARRLRTSKWILNKADELVSAEDVTVQTLSDKYDKKSAEASALINFLEIHDEAQDAMYLSDEEKRKIKLAEDIEQFGLSEAEVRAALDDAKKRKNAQTSDVNGSPIQSQNDFAIGNSFRDSLPTEADGTEKSKQRFDPDEISDDMEIPRLDVLREIGKRAAQLRNPASRTPQSSERDTEPDGDDDDYLPRPVDYDQKIKRAEERIACEVGVLERAKELTEIATAAEKYSFAWFKALLELEGIRNGDSANDGKQISIGFGKVSLESGTAKTLRLEHPSRYIPPSIEELTGFRLDLDLKGKKRCVTVESVSVKGYTLRAKLKSSDEIKGLKLADVAEARIDVQSPSFLLKALQERFAKLPFADTDDLQRKLPSNIEFVFGPPGTGKTTHLAEKVLIPLMRDAENKRVLVLAPTNKAADVLVSRIMSSMGGDRSYEDWLARFGTTNDETIETAGVSYDRTDRLGDFSRCVVVTTIARFTYDTFATGGDAMPLDVANWDFIVIDEASMIPLANIVYPIYKQTPKRFIIAGDPFQIEPITAVEQWKAENIYTLVGLKSFSDPQTVPHPFRVTTLTTQYRSVPTIGTLFSRFAYDGILAHHRPENSQRPLSIEGEGMHISPLNIVEFPVSPYESIYRAKRLQNKTPYQPYSALFTFEFVKFLSAQIQPHSDCERPCRIGIIAPYRAQADLIDKLIASWHSCPEHVEIQTGTIHGFQGDECDIILAVFNPPPSISSDPRMFLNKLNILNVAISRARDYLFVLMPDEQTENRRSMKRVQQIEDLITASGAFVKSHSRDIEKLMFGNERHLEDNAFSTSHQFVNVYGKPEKQYEIRSEDTAVDIQVQTDGLVTKDGNEILEERCD